MTESHIVYEPWQSLDPGRRYCLVDTMVLLQIYRRDARLAAMADAVRGGRDLLLVPDVVDECESVFRRHKPDLPSAESMLVGDGSGGVYEHIFGAAPEDFAVEPRLRGDFDRLLAEVLRGFGMEFAAAVPEPGALDGAGILHAKKMYKNKKGDPLSPVDCLILNMAMENDNVDVITDDLALARAVVDKCGGGRVSGALGAYFGRRNMTARFLGEALNLGSIRCDSTRDAIEYRAVGARKDQASQRVLVEVHLSPDGIWATRGPAIRYMERDDTDDALLALCTFVELVMLDWYCACWDTDWTKFDKKWTDVEYDYDTMQVKSRANRPYYDIAKSVLKKNRGRYCACSKPNERRLHEGFRDIMAEAD